MCLLGPQLRTPLNKTDQLPMFSAAFRPPWGPRPGTDSAPIGRQRSMPFPSTMLRFYALLAVADAQPSYYDAGRMDSVFSKGAGNIWIIWH